MFGVDKNEKHDLNAVEKFIDGLPESKRVDKDEFFQYFGQKYYGTRDILRREIGILNQKFTFEKEAEIKVLIIKFFWRVREIF